MHNWSDDDNLVAYCLYRLGSNEHTFGIQPKELGDILGMGYNSLGLKVSNFKAICEPGGMAGYSLQAQRIERQYRNLSDVELRDLGIEAVQRALDKYSNAS